MSLSYSRWDDLHDSDDEPAGSRRPLLRSEKGRGQLEADAAVSFRFSSHLDAHLRHFPKERRELAAKFIGAQHRGEESSNIYRYSDICAFLTRFAPDLADGSFLSMLCELHQRMVDALPPTKQRQGRSEELKDCEVRVTSSFHTPPALPALFLLISRVGALW